MNGKGSKPRPLAVSREEYDRRWAEVFGRPNDTRKKDTSSPARESQPAAPRPR
jgi:hypothetical protein